jgi:Na+-driven multidrug efflux pump
MTLVFLMPVWAGIRILEMGSVVTVVTGIGIVAIGLITFLVAFRFVRREPDPTGDGSYEVTQEHVDYAVWMALGVPFAFIGLLVLLLLTGSLNGR